MGVDHDDCGFKPWRSCFQSQFARLSLALHNRHTQAVEGVPPVRFIGLMTAGVAISYTDQATVA